MEENRPIGEPFEFGTTNGGEPVHAIRLGNRQNGEFELCVITMGAAIQSAWLPWQPSASSSSSSCSPGGPTNVVLGFDNARDYETANDAYLGVVVGRVSGRITNASFTLPANGEGGGKVVHVTENKQGYMLHGGHKGLSKRVWRIFSHSTRHVSLEIVSHDGDEGFPGTLRVAVHYRLLPPVGGQPADGSCNTNTSEEKREAARHGFEIEYEAVLLGPAVCPVNLTNHAYFNLAGPPSPTSANQQTGDPSTDTKTDIYAHRVWLAADRYLDVDANTLCPNGGVLCAADSPANDVLCRQDEEGATLGSLIQRYFEPKTRSRATASPTYAYGFDTYYVISEAARGFEKGPHATVRLGDTRLEMHTDQPGLVFYTGNFLGGAQGEQEGRVVGGLVMKRHGGLCLETCVHPDAVNHTNFPDIFLDGAADSCYTHRTRYEFFNEAL